VGDEAHVVASESERERSIHEIDLQLGQDLGESGLLLIRKMETLLPVVPIEAKALGGVAEIANYLLLYGLGSVIPIDSEAVNQIFLLGGIDLGSLCIIGGFRTLVQIQVDNGPCCECPIRERICGLSLLLG